MLGDHLDIKRRGWVRFNAEQAAEDRSVCNALPRASVSIHKIS